MNAHVTAQPAAQRVCSLAERLDVLLTREYQAGNETKTAFTKVGVAFATKNGGWSVQMEAMPAPVDGLFKFVLFPVKAKDDNGGGRQPSSGNANRSQPGGYSSTEDSEIPF